MDTIGTIVAKVIEDRKVNVHTNSAHPIDAKDESLITQLQTAFPDCRVYVDTMVTGIYDKKTFIEERVRLDLKKLCENPRLCVVVDWSAV